MKKFDSLLGESRRAFIITFVIGVIYSCISVFSPTATGELINSVLTESGSRAVYIILFLAVNLLLLVMCALDEHSHYAFTIKNKARLRRKSLAAFADTGSGTREDTSSFVSFINNDIPSITDDYVYGVKDISTCTVMVLLSAASLFGIHWSLALVILSISIMVVVFPNMLRKRGGAARQSYSDSLGKYNTLVRSVLDGLHIVRTYRCKMHMLSAAESANSYAAACEKKRYNNSVIVTVLTTALQVAKVVLILLIGIRLIEQGKINVGNLITAIQLGDMIAAPIDIIAYLRHARNETKPIAEKYFSLVNGASAAAEGGCRANAFERLNINGVSYGIDDVQILSNVNAQFDSGKKYLIVGESGSGKSTLLRLISRIINGGYSGSITYNGTDIRSIDMGSYYGAICPVFQEPYLFYTTFEDNICLGRSVDKAEYDSVIHRLNLDYLIERYAGQEITPEITEALSGGEKQRVALARAMLGKPGLYLLDEVTSALDKANSQTIEELLLGQNAAVIHVCHKPNPSLLSRYDAVYEMHGGVLTGKQI